MGSDKKNSKKHLSDEDIRIWNMVTNTAIPLDKSQKNYSTSASFDFAKEKTAAHSDQASSDNLTTRNFILQPSYQAPKPFIPDPSTQLDMKTSRKISKGKIAIQGQIDLHGMTMEQAHRQLYAYLEYAYYSERRTVLVITGKGIGGMGVLRENVPRWLNEIEFRRYVSSFAISQARHGGDGALYVRLKRK